MVILSSLSLFVCSYAFCQKEGPEIIIRGKKFNTMHEYRLKQLKSNLEDKIKYYKESNLAEYLASLEKIYLVKKRAEFTSEEIIDIFKEFKSRYNSLKTIETTDIMVNEMKEMLKKQRNITVSDKTVIIDPHKVKTVIIGSANKLDQKSDYLDITP